MFKLLGLNCEKSIIIKREWLYLVIGRPHTRHWGESKREQWIHLWGQNQSVSLDLSTHSLTLAKNCDQDKLWDWFPNYVYTKPLVRAPNCTVTRSLTSMNWNDIRLVIAFITGHGYFRKQGCTEKTLVAGFVGRLKVCWTIVGLM